LAFSASGESARPFATIEGQRYEVAVDRSGGTDQQYVVNGAQRLAIKGQDDGSVQLLGPDKSVVRTIAKGGFEPGGGRHAVYTMMMLIGLSMVTVGNGFFKP